MAHAALLVVLALTSHAAFRGANLSQEGIALSSVEAADERFFPDESRPAVDEIELAETAAPRDGQLVRDAPASHDTDAAAPEVALPNDPLLALPQLEPWTGPQTTLAAATASGQSLTEGSRAGTQLAGGQARTSVFGAPGEGYKFVYVFDRSGSMGGFEQKPLRAAKSELLGSLASLASTHQFQIVFYNERPELFRVDNRPWKLVFGNERSKRLAQQFVGGITAVGSTEHMAALSLALALRPDVIFFLTDADQPELTPAQLEKIRRQNGGQTMINAIEFGVGAQLDRNNFLVRLARENGGQHVYVDLTKLPGDP